MTAVVNNFNFTNIGTSNTANDTSVFPSHIQSAKITNIPVASHFYQNSNANNISNAISSTRPKTTNVANQLAETSGELKTLIIEPVEDLSREHRPI